MRNVTGIIVVFAVTWATLAPATAGSAKLSGPARAAAKFSVSGVRLGDSMERFTGRFPTARKWRIPVNSYPRNDVYELSVDNGTTAPPNVTFEFERGQLKFITIMYSQESRKLIERKDRLLTQLERRFGKSKLTLKAVQTDFGPADQYEWQFEEAGVDFSCQLFDDGSARFNAFLSDSLLPAKPQTSRLGFD
ncbi:MAG: hypothetical protein NXI04_24185 [Planctomycetaceae bacterium]|nr:hypothetical protein [Planctomycetaceae bacterium]